MITRIVIKDVATFDASEHVMQNLGMDHIVVWMILTILLHILMELHDTLPCLKMFFKKQDILHIIT